MATPVQTREPARIHMASRLTHPMKEATLLSRLILQEEAAVAEEVATSHGRLGATQSSRLLH